MTRKSALVTKRKQDLNSKLNELRCEGHNVVKYVQGVIDQGIAIVRELEIERDHVIFLQRYPFVVIKLNRLLNKVMELNCNIELGASDDETEDSVQYNPCVTKQTLLRNKSTVHNCEILTSENPIQSGAARNGNPDIRNNSIPSETTPSTTSKNVLPSCPVQEGEILDMCYLHGNTPYNFWLRYYATKSLDYLNETMLRRYYKNQLRPYDVSLLCVGTYVCAFNGRECFRGKVLKIRLAQTVCFMILDVDSGRIQKIEEDSVFKLDEDLLEIPVQALNCCLQGNLGDPSLWNDQMTPLFCKLLTESTLVVTVCGKVKGDPPQFLVEIDCHNEERIISKIELNKWIIYSVLPKLKEMKENPEDDKILKSLYSYLNPVIRDEEECREQNLPSENFSHREISSPSSQKPDSKVFCPGTVTVGQNQSYNQDQGNTSSLSEMKQSSPQKHKEFTPYQSHKSHPSVSKSMDSPMNNKWTLSESNFISLPPTFDQSKGSDRNCLSPSSYFMPASHSVINDIIGNTILPLPEGKSISLHQPVLLPLVGQSYSVMLAHIEDPGEFYIHMVCEENVEIGNLQNQMTQYYSIFNVIFESKEDAKKHIGLFCAAIYDADGHWYRAQVIDWNQDSDDDPVTIKYVDYGNQSSVHYYMLQPLRIEFTKLPICARQCHLAMIHPHTSTEDKILKSWSHDAAYAFKFLVNVQSVYRVFVMESTDNSLCSLPVLLQDCHNDGSSVINKILVNLGYAVSFCPIDCSLYDALREERKVLSATQGENIQNTKTDKGSHEDSSCKEQISVLDMPHQMESDVIHESDPMSEDYFSVTNTLYHNDEDACYAVTGYKPQDENRICKFYALKGRCFKGEGCLKEHSYPHPDGWTTDKEPVFINAFSELVYPDVQDKILVQITHITKVNAFYAVLYDQCQRSSGRVQIRRTGTEEDDEKEETLITLNDYLNEERNVKALRRCAVKPGLGQIVVARFREDGRFYRARIIDYSEESVLVFFVDFGNKEWVSETDIYDIEPKYLHLPFQAIECVLANVDNISEDTEATEFFGNLVCNKTLCAQVIARLHHLSRLELLLWDENLCDIGTLIIQSGYGKERIYSTRNFVI
jgi:hypothetical protein